MSFSYNKLWKKLIDNKMKKIDLQNAVNISPQTMAKMGRDENVSLDTIDKICVYFQCDIGDIMEIRNEEKNNEQ